jgi:hypothetical protein
MQTITISKHTRRQVNLVHGHLRPKGYTSLPYVPCITMDEKKRRRAVDKRAKAARKQNRVTR